MLCEWVATWCLKQGTSLYLVPSCFLIDFCPGCTVHFLSPSLNLATPCSLCLSSLPPIPHPCPGPLCKKGKFFFSL